MFKKDVGEAIDLIKQVQGELLKEPDIGIVVHQNLVSEMVAKLVN